MNDGRRKSLKTLYDQFIDLKDQLETIKEDEEECRDNIPDNLLGSEQYERAEEACSNLEEAIYNLDGALENIESAFQ